MKKDEHDLLLVVGALLNAIGDLQHRCSDMGHLIAERVRDLEPSEKNRLIRDSKELGDLATKTRREAELFTGPVTRNSECPA